MSFASNLKRAMRESCTNTTELAKAAGVSKSSISQYTSGAKFPRPETLDKIAEALDCTAESLTSDKPPADGTITKKITVAEAARTIGTGEQLIRKSIQQGTCPFGFEVRGNKRNTYHISPYRLKTYIGNAKKNSEVFKKHVKWWSDCLNENNSSTDKYWTETVISELVSMYSEISGIGYDEAAKILHKVDRDED